MWFPEDKNLCFQWLWAVVQEWEIERQWTTAEIGRLNPRPIPLVIKSCPTCDSSLKYSPSVGHRITPVERQEKRRITPPRRKRWENKILEVSRVKFLVSAYRSGRCLWLGPNVVTGLISLSCLYSPGRASNWQLVSREWKTHPTVESRDMFLT